MGGLTELLSLIFSHESDEVRGAACSLVTSIMTNNRQVQEFASKSGIINLVGQFDLENNISVKNKVFSCLTAWLKADNFEGKRRFLTEFQGLEFLARLVTQAAMDANFNPRLKVNIHRLVHDLVLNDDGIFEERPFHVHYLLQPVVQTLISNFPLYLSGLFCVFDLSSSFLWYSEYTYNIIY